MFNHNRGGPQCWCILFFELLLEGMTKVYKENEKKVKGIAISCPGTVDVNAGMIYHGGALPYLHKQNLAGLLQDQCNIPVTIENDAKSAAIFIQMSLHVNFKMMQTYLGHCITFLKFSKKIV
ncbi:Beta-glucoside kinase [Paenibacillus larvae subsp. larvae]|uniref:Beta-glucoside kinase n=2 Tax=Paenibacillus larvae TaxID=1464 RepID=A0A2L1U0V3_9BACL|nr:Beta-glucoside kinase [Paenibacillus larvae subsp. larvae]AVF31292.1 Beta-glucoside kinase [Paenibacillus larvae subsp. larvae]